MTDHGHTPSAQFTMQVSAGLRAANAVFLVSSIAAIFGLTVWVVSLIKHAAEPRMNGIGDPWWADVVGAVVMLALAVLLAFGARVSLRNVRTVSVVHTFQKGAVVRTLLDSNGAQVRRDEFPIDTITATKIKPMGYGRYAVVLKRRLWGNSLLLGVAGAEDAQQLASRIAAACDSAL